MGDTLEARSGGTSLGTAPVVVSAAGGEMRRILLALVTVVVAIGLSSWVFARGVQQDSKQLKDRQKAETKALKLKHKYSKD